MRIKVTGRTRRTIRRSGHKGRNAVRLPRGARRLKITATAADGSRAIVTARLRRYSGWQAGHQYVVRPPTCRARAEFRSAGTIPPLSRDGMKRPVWTPPLRIASRVAARSSRRNRSRSSTDSSPAGASG